MSSPNSSSFEGIAHAVYSSPPFADHTVFLEENYAPYACVIQSHACTCGYRGQKSDKNVLCFFPGTVTNSDLLYFLINQGVCAPCFYLSDLLRRVRKSLQKSIVNSPAQRHPSTFGSRGRHETAQREKTSFRGGKSSSKRST